MEGYRSKVWNQMKVASYLRESLRNMKNADGINYFQILDGGDRSCLPVVAARLNPELDVPYDDIDLQHALSESLWYVSGYALGFEDPCGGDEELSLCSDVGPETTMFRIVVKSNLTMRLAQNLKKQFEITLPILDSMEDGYRSMHSAKELVRKAEAAADDVFVTATVVKAAKKWMSRRKSAKEKLMGYEEEKPASTRRLRRGSVAC
jgi:glutamate/tyrosine decarboxylase-like PLP-dependent enzyme